MSILSLDDRKALKLELEEYYQPLFNQFKVYEDLYNTNLTLDLPEGIEPITVPVGRWAIEDCTDQISTASLRVFVKPRSPKKQVEADKLEKFYLGCWHRVTQYRNHLRDAAKHGMLYGMFCFKPLWDLSVLDEESSPLLPLTLRVIHPRNLLPDPSSDPPRYVMEIKHMKLGQVMQMQWVKDSGWTPPNWDSNGLAMSLSSDVEWVEYWDKDYWAIDCEGEVIKPPVEHGLGRIPHVIQYAGFGIEPEGGKPEERVRGLLHDLGDIVAAVSRNYSLQEAIMLRYAGPVTDITSDNPEFEYKTVPGSKNYLTLTDSVIVRTPETPSDELLRQRSALLYTMDRATAPAVIRGERPTGVSAGYPIAILAGQARVKFDSVQKALNNACSLVNEIWATIVEKVIEEPITVWAKTPQGLIDEVIKPSDIDGYTTNFCDLQAIDPQEEERKIRLGIEIKASGMPVPERYIMENFFSMSNAQDLQEEFLVEQALKTDEVRAVLTRIALEKFGFEAIQQEAVNQAEALMKAPPGGEAPGEMLSQFPHQFGAQPAERNQPERKPEPVWPGSPEEMDLMRRQRQRPRAPRPGEPLPR